MKLGMYVILDHAAQAFSQPYFAPNNGIAIRGFTDAVNDPNKATDISKHPHQFTLMKLGEFDNNSAKVETHEPKQLITGVEVINDDAPRYTNIDLKQILEAVANLEEMINPAKKSKLREVK